MIQVFKPKQAKVKLSRHYTPETLGIVSAIHAAIWLNSRFIFTNVGLALYEGQVHE